MTRPTSFAGLLPGLTALMSSDRVCMLRVAMLAGAVLLPRGARGSRPARQLQHGVHFCHAARQMSTRHWHQRQAARDGRVKSGGAREHANAVRRDRLGSAAACAWPCLRRSAPTSESAGHFSKMKSGPHADPPSSHERRASPRPARWQDASFWRTGRIQRASGATGVPWHSPVSMPLILSRCGVLLRLCEVGLSGLTAVVYVHTRGPASVSSISPPHGLGACTRRRSQTLIVTSVFTYCRKTTPVVSGPRETRRGQGTHSSPAGACAERVDPAAEGAVWRLPHALYYNARRDREREPRRWFCGLKF